MWYPSQQHCQSLQQPTNWHGYMNNFSSQQQRSPLHHHHHHQQQRTCLRTTYYSNNDESTTTYRANTQLISKNDKNESFVHFNSKQTDDVNVTGTDYHITNSTGSNTDEMSSSSLPYQTSNLQWNPSTKTSIIANSSLQNRSTSTSSISSSSSTSGCWDWLLYSPEYYSHLYIPSSSFVQQQQQDDDFDLLARLPTWLLAVLYPSMKQYNTRDDENDSDQEITSLSTNHDEALLSINIDKSINKVSSNLSLSSENNTLNNSQKVSKDRSATPDTDDGYQSASDASRSDCSQQSSLQYDHHTSKDDVNINNSSTLAPKRISYAAAVKPLTTSTNNNMKTTILPSTPAIKTKTNSSSLTINDMLNNNNNNNQKLKFVAPRFERMHHAKQYSSSTITTTTTKDSSLSSISLTNRTPTRSNNHHNQRNHMNNSARRR